MSDRHRVRRERITVGKTKVAKAPWEEDRYVYNVKVGSEPLFSSNIYIFIIQIIVGIFAFIYFWNAQSGGSDANITPEEHRLIEQQFNPNNLPPSVRDWKPLNQRP